ncbi:MAG: nucleotidyl transferase AbiEii/AbiGii toxin family protein [Burkholderiales bacterium]
MNAARTPRDQAASIRQRLLNLAKSRGEEFQPLLDRYALERLLYRLSVSDRRSDFMLKGALLFGIWFNEPHRPTRDADFLGFGPPDEAYLAATLKQHCAADLDDGLKFDTNSIRVLEIRKNTSYTGLRVNLLAMLGNARCHIQIDVGFGDVVTPGPVEIDFPCLLNDSPVPRLRVYPRETACAEKFEAITQLGITNTRMKDYFDLLALAREGAMDGPTVARAIAATFERRGTQLPEAAPIGLTPQFARDAQRQEMWGSFLLRNRLHAPTLAEVIDELASFFRPLLQEAHRLHRRRGAA